VLPAGSRVRRSAEFGEVVRRGRRCGRAALVVHLMPTATGDAARAGVVVGRAVGGAVVRNKVRRRLRGQLAERLPSVPDGSLLVVRALPPAAAASYAELGIQLSSALRKLEAAGP
jgi:ribonuclease P protein component